MSQRVRNRIIEALELAADFDAQIDYQVCVPIAQVAVEVIEGWYDSFDLERSVPQLIPPIFTAEESAALREFHENIEAISEALPQELPAIEQAQLLPEWDKLRQKAQAALAVMHRRGRLPEDHEI